MRKANKQKQSNDSGLDFEAQLWAAADKMRGHMDASEYKHVCLGLIFLKYISDAFEEKREQLLFGFSDPRNDSYIKDETQGDAADNERDEYIAANVFWLPPEARWHTINAKAKSPEIGKVIDDAMGAIERENPTLKGVLPRDYARCAVANSAVSLRRFSRKSPALRQRIVANVEESRTLAALLPKLLSGELRLPSQGFGTAGVPDLTATASARAPTSTTA